MHAKRDSDVKQTVESPSSDRLSRGVLWGGLALILLVLGGVVLWGGQGDGLSRWTTRDELATFGAVPDFALLERSGRPVTRSDLLGKVWVVGFIYTRCVDECPLMSQHMAGLQRAFAREENLRWVSITLDPEYDTRQVLTRYAENFGANPEHWWFLTGDKNAIHQLAQEGFHLGIRDRREARRSSCAWRVMRTVRQVLTPTTAWAHHGEHQQNETPQTLMHSARFVLVDRRGQIRGYYDSREEAARRRLRRHIEILLKDDK